MKMIESDYEQYEQKRSKGENDNHICLLIQNDEINEFIKYVNTANLPLTSTIRPSVFETNLFILKRGATLIEYSVYYGAIQIFKYLLMNKVSISQSLWLYAIHGNNPEIIHILENDFSDLTAEMLDEIYKESIKCHHKDIINYVKNNYNYIQYTLEKKSIYINYCLQFFNFSEFSEILSDINDFNDICRFEATTEGNQKFNAFYGFCRYDNYIIFKYLLDNLSVDINAKIIILHAF